MDRICVLTSCKRRSYAVPGRSPTAARGSGESEAQSAHNTAMPRCASCASENPAGFRFCGTCGAPLSSDGCPDCGFVNPQGQRFCGRCGGRLSVQLATAVRPEQGEPKLATVMFADVVGFTALAEVSDPETLARAVDSA